MKKIILKSWIIIGLFIVPLILPSSSNAHILKTKKDHSIERDSAIRCQTFMLQALEEGDSNYASRFVNMMIQQEQGSVDLARLSIGKLQRPELNQMSSEIISSDGQNVATLKNLRAQRPYAPVPTNQDLKVCLEKRFNLVNLPGQDFDHVVLDALIAQEEDTLAVASEALNRIQDIELKQIITKTVKSCRQELERLTKWRQHWYR